MSKIFGDDDEGGDIKAEEDLSLHHPAVEVSLTTSLQHLRQIAVDACPPQTTPGTLLAAQRTLLCSGAARLTKKGLSTDTETYRRLGVLVPHYRYPTEFKHALVVLRDYWQHHGRALSLGRAAPYRRVQQRAARYLRLKANNLSDGCDDSVADPESLLPTPTTVRVFRLVNGNLEIPPTLFKALVCAGRLEDSFFPDERAIWGDSGGIGDGRRPPGATGIGIKVEDDDGSNGGSGGAFNSDHSSVIDTLGDDDNDPLWPRSTHVAGSSHAAGNSNSTTATALHATHYAASPTAPVFVFNPTINIMPSHFGGAEDGLSSSRTASMLAGMVDSFRSFATTVVAAAGPATGAALPALAESVAPTLQPGLLLAPAQTRDKQIKREGSTDIEGQSLPKKSRL